VARYPYLGSDARHYPQYLQLDAEYPAEGGKGPKVTGPRPLNADPGGVYEIGPAPGYVTVEKDGTWTSLLAIPPGDGRWGPAVTGTNTEDVSESAAPAKTRKGESA